MSLLQQMKAFWQSLDECATDHDPLADLERRVAHLERQASRAVIATNEPIAPAQAACPEQTGTGDQ
jgi:hypothetical protein